VIYRLEATRGLHVFIRTQNVGDEIAPYGAGAHPYLTCNLQPIDDCELTLPVIEETCDERYFTTPQRIAQTLSIIRSGLCHLTLSGKSG
jgi:aldose 1-epimerase